MADLILFMLMMIPTLIPRGWRTAIVPASMRIGPDCLDWGLLLGGEWCSKVHVRLALV